MTAIVPLHPYQDTRPCDSEVPEAARAVRIQLSRRRGFRLQATSLALNGLPAVRVARPSGWGNPYRAGHSCCFGGAFLPSIDTEDLHREIALPRYHETCWDTETAVRWFAELLVRCQPEAGIRAAELRGHNLGCWCPLDQPCHADVLLEVANG